MLLSPGIPWVRIGLAAILILAIGATGFESGRRWVLAGWNAEKTEQAEADRDAAQEAQRITARLNAKTQGVQDAYAKTAAKSRADAASASAALVSLRLAIDEASAATDDPAAPGRVDGAGVVFADVVRACSTALVDVAKDADARQARLTALQDWVKAITEPPSQDRPTRMDR